MHPSHPYVPLAADSAVRSQEGSRSGSKVRHIAWQKTLGFPREKEDRLTFPNLFFSHLSYFQKVCASYTGACFALVYSSTLQYTHSLFIPMCNSALCLQFNTASSSLWHVTVFGDTQFPWGTVYWACHLWPNSRGLFNSDCLGPTQVSMILLFTISFSLFLVVMSLKTKQATMPPKEIKSLSLSAFHDLYLIYTMKNGQISAQKRKC